MTETPALQMSATEMAIALSFHLILATTETHVQRINVILLQVA